MNLPTLTTHQSFILEDSIATNNYDSLPQRYHAEEKGFLNRVRADSRMMQVSSPLSSTEEEKMSFVASIRKTASYDEYLPSAAEMKAMKEKAELRRVYSMQPKQKTKLAPITPEGAHASPDNIFGSIQRVDSWKQIKLGKSASLKGRSPRPFGGAFINSDAAAVTTLQRTDNMKQQPQEFTGRTISWKTQRDLSIEIPQSTVEDDEEITLTERMIRTEDYNCDDDLDSNEPTPPPLMKNHSSRLLLFTNF